MHIKIYEDDVHCNTHSIT